MGVLLLVCCLEQLLRYTVVCCAAQEASTTHREHIDKKINIAFYTYAWLYAN